MYDSVVFAEYIVAKANSCDKYRSFECQVSSIHKRHSLDYVACNNS